MKAEKMGILSALLASSCCVLPLVLALLGLGSLGVGSFLGTYHWYLQGAAVLILALAWGMFLREQRRTEALASEDACRKACAAKDNEKWTQASLVLASLVVAAFLASSLYGALKASPQKVAFTEVEGLTLAIPVAGMSCATCEMPIEKGLKNLPGVYKAEASSATGTVTVHYDPSRVTPEQIAAAIQSAGYRPRLPRS